MGSSCSLPDLKLFVGGWMVRRRTSCEWKRKFPITSPFRNLYVQSSARARCRECSVCWEKGSKVDAIPHELSIFGTLYKSRHPNLPRSQLFVFGATLTNSMCESPVLGEECALTSQRA